MSVKASMPGNLLIVGLILFLATPNLLRGFWGFDGARQNFVDVVWEAEMDTFAQEAYAKAVAEVFASFEATTGRKLAPGEHRRAALKIYTNSGMGLATPLELVRAVVAALEERGFDRSEIFLLDLHESRLRETGYLPPLSEREAPQAFAGVPVYALEAGRFYNETWFYESPLPPEVPSRWGAILFPERLEIAEDPDRRKSFLPSDLLTEVDFWINLPVGVGVRGVGLSGAMANATLWNVSNYNRFFASPANAPVVMAEISAIPELQANEALTLLSLERYQFIGGPQFNSYYTRTEARLLASVNPAAVDSILLEKVNLARLEEGFDPLPDPLPAMIFAAELGVGPFLREDFEIIEVP